MPNENNIRKTYWFPAKRFGWGWGLPVTWQGWLVFILFLLAVLAAAITIRPEENVVSRVLIIMGLSALYILTCWLKGEPVGRRQKTRDDQDQEQ